MSSTQFSLPAATWVQITTTDKKGSIRHQSGDTTVVYTESATAPAALSAATPIMEATLKSQDWAYFSVGASDFVWAHANSADAVIVVSPGGA
tara:strand:+ start:2146 stop:2421 length:276 start_codon:yes stop_codon:yes gene_type:complete